MNRWAVVLVVAVVFLLVGGLYALRDTGSRPVPAPVAAIPVPVVAPPVPAIPAASAPMVAVPVPVAPPPKIVLTPTHEETRPEPGCVQRACGTSAAATSNPAPFSNQNPQWMERLHNWMAQRDAILKDPSLSPQERQTQIDQLRTQQFSPEEQQRLQSMELVHDNPK